MSKAYEKIDHTLCINQWKGNLQFGLDTEEHIDCSDVYEMTECLDTVGELIKCLELIIKKSVNVNTITGLLECFPSYTDEALVGMYNAQLYRGMEELTLDEFSSIKRVCIQVAEEVALESLNKEGN